ncbi:hypothetical protein JCM15519_10190 [Fundidesulfovibrio butyratiphilus]
MPKSSPLEDLACRLEASYLPWALHLMRIPQPELCGMEDGLFREQASGILEKLADDAAPLFLQYIGASLLLGPSDAAAWNWLAAREDLVGEALGLNQPLETLRPWQWNMIALPLAHPGENRGSLVFTMLGYARDFDNATLFLGRTRRRLDEAAVSAVETAAELARTDTASPGRYIFWPILDPCSQGMAIAGASIGLPTFLGFCDCARGSRSPRMVATGVVAPDRTLHAVQRETIALKRQACQGHFRSFLFPRPAGGAPLPEEEGPVEALPVDSLDKAILCWNAHAPGQGRNLTEFLGQGTGWLKNLADTPEAVCPILEHNRDFIAQRLLDLDAKEEGTLEFVIMKTKALLERAEKPIGRIESILSVLGPELVDDLIEKERTNLALDIALLHQNAANHCGDIENAAFWHDKICRIAKSAKPQNERQHKQFFSVICNLVGWRHNGFHFLCEHYTGWKDLDALRNTIETIHTQLFPGQDVEDSQLGSLFGALAQDYGFRGGPPERVGAYARMARKAFGEPAKEHKADWLRQYLHEMYAYLDAERFPEAQKALLAYLDVPSPDAVDPEGLNPYQHLALARFLADTGTPLPGYLKWVETESAAYVARQGWQHPVQLLTYNLGRISPAPSRREEFWRTSIACCLHPASKTTIRIMALLPLCALVDEEPECLASLAEQTKEALSATQAYGVCPSHFAGLRACRSPADSLAYVAHHVKALFPYSYR